MLYRLLLCAGITLLCTLILDDQDYQLELSLRGDQQVYQSILIVKTSEKDRQSMVNTLLSYHPKAVFDPGKIPINNTINIFDFLEKSNKLKDPKSLPPEHKEYIYQILSLSKKKGGSFINFRGSSKAFNSISKDDILNKNFVASLLRNKYIILCDESSNLYNNNFFQRMSGSEYFANIIDNALGERWIKPVNRYGRFFIGLLIVIFLSIAISLLPSSLSLVSLIFALIFVISTSLFLFDYFYIWFPIKFSLFLILGSYFLFLHLNLSRREQLTWQLEKDKKYSSEMSELKKNFLNLFSHDLKTPIAKIIAQLDILEGRSLHKDPDSVKTIQKVRKYAQDLNKHVKNILRISQIEANQFSIRKLPCDPNTIIQQVTKDLLVLARDKDISIKESLTPLFSVNCDKDLIYQIVHNLIENAIKYSKKNCEIEILSEEDDNFLTVSIKDFGQIIPKEQHDHIWKKFSRLQDHFEGTGLGLYLVRYFVEAHGGAVFIETLDNGNCIGFKIPV